MEIQLNPGATNSIKLQNDGGSTFTYGVEIDKFSVSPKQFKVSEYIPPASFQYDEIDTDSFNHITDVTMIGFHTLDVNGNIVTRTDDPDLANWQEYNESMHEAVGTRPVKK